MGMKVANFKLHKFKTLIVELKGKVLFCSLTQKV